MVTLKCKVLPLDTCGKITGGEARELELSLYNGDDLAAISTYTLFRMFISRDDGGTLIVPNASFTIVDDGVDADLLGRLDLALVPADTELFRRGENIQFMIEATDASAAKTYYWGCFDEVCNPII